MNLTLRLALDLYNNWYLPKIYHHNTIKSIPILKEIALKEERSINGEINYIIRKYIEEKEKEVK